MRGGYSRVSKGGEGLVPSPWRGGYVHLPRAGLGHLVVGVTLQCGNGEAQRSQLPHDVLVLLYLSTFAKPRHCSHCVLTFMCYTLRQWAVVISFYKVNELPVLDRSCAFTLSYKRFGIQ